MQKHAALAARRHALKGEAWITRHDSLSASAKDLHVAQSTVKRRLASLEAELLSLERTSAAVDTGLVRITCAEAMATHILAPCLATLHQRQSDITIELIPNTRELSLSMREADVSVRLRRSD